MTAVRALLVLLAFLVVVVAPAGAASDVRVTLTASSATPVADTPWRYQIIVKDRQGDAVRTKARLQILRGTTVVGWVKRTAIVPCRGPSSGTWISFAGKRVGTVKWAPRFVGARLIFRATVVANGRALRLRIPVRVQAP